MTILKSPVWVWGKGFLLAFLAIRVSFWLGTFPNPDEAYYWLWGQHPGFSYYDHPPFHAWVQGLFAAAFGRSNLVLRLPNAISSGLLAWTFYRICRYLYGHQGTDRFWLVVLLLVSSPLFFLFLAMAWNDHWLVTFAVISSFWFVRFIDSYGQTGRGKSHHLYGAALTLGLAGLCKYNAVFIGLGFLATVLTTRRLRSLFGDYRLYLAVVLLALVLSPILVWNLQHDFFSFRFYAERSAGEAGLTINLLQPVAFLALCGLILGPIQSWSIWRLGRQNWPRRRQQSESHQPTQSYAEPCPSAPDQHGSFHPAPGQPALSYYSRVAGWIFGLSTAAFTLLSLVSVAIYYWNILAYPLLFPLLTDQFYRPAMSSLRDAPATATNRGALRRSRQLLTAQIIGLVAAGALVFHYTVVPFTAFLGGDVDPDSAALYGWADIAAAVETAAGELDNPLLLTTDYRSAAALAYQLDTPDVLAISGRIDQSDFRYDSETLNGRDAVLLGESWHPICPTHLAMFDHTEASQTLEVQRFGTPLQTYQLVAGHGFQAGAPGAPLQPDYPLAFTSDGEQCQF
jgi:4-amino-4-deoxy-L-arabinose transferase-like glycosyltransferase